MTPATARPPRTLRLALPLVALLSVLLVSATTGPSGPSARTAPAPGGDTGPQLVSAPAAAVGGSADPRSRSGARGAAGNPLAGHRWGVYKGKAEPSWEPYTRSSGRERALLGTIALRPKAKWFGRWIAPGEIAAKVRSYVASATGGDRDVLVQFTSYRVDPWQKDACRRLPTRAQKASYRRWVDSFVRAIGNTRAQVIVQPDGPFQKCAPRGSKVYKRLIAYQVRKLATLPRTTSYIEIGSAGWNHRKARNAVNLLRGSGIGSARGFHMNVTHYEATGREVRFGTRVVRALRRVGFAGKHFTVDTAENGKPFTHTYSRRHHGGNFNHAPVCRQRTSRKCVTLGIPPTADVGNPAWNLPADVRSMAVRHVDGFVWAGRPWLDTQSYPFEKPRALRLVRTTPFPRYPG